MISNEADNDMQKEVQIMSIFDGFLHFNHSPQSIFGGFLLINYGPQSIFGGFPNH